MHTDKHTQTHMCTHTRTHRYKHIETHKHTHNTHAYTEKQTQTHIQMHIHYQTHTYTTHTQHIHKHHTHRHTRICIPHTTNIQVIVYMYSLLSEIISTYHIYFYNLWFLAICRSPVLSTSSKYRKSDFPDCYKLKSGLFVFWLDYRQQIYNTDIRSTQLQ